MSTHNICFCGEIRKKYQYLPRAMKLTCLEILHLMRHILNMSRMDVERKI